MLVNAPNHYVSLVLASVDQGDADTCDIGMWYQRWADCHILWSRSSPDFQNLVQFQP